MTPKEKAEELVESMYNVDEYDQEPTMTWKHAIQCALIAVYLRLEGDFTFTSIEYGEDSLEYWEQVKNEIELL